MCNSCPEPKDDFDFDAFVADLETKPEDIQVRNKEDAREKFPCQSCCGTGQYQGVRLHQPKEHCFACKGKGYFYTSEYDRKKARQQRQESKARKLLDARAAFDEANPGLADFLLKAGEWSEFARSLYANIQQWGALTDRQLESAQRMRLKCEARAIERAAAKSAEAKAREEVRQTVENSAPELATIAEAFLKGAQSLKFPKLRLITEDGQRVVLTRCGGASKTPGHINITDGGSFGDNRYFGRISPEGRVFYRDDAPATVRALLTEMNADPAAAVKVQGQRTGQCCICARELTDPESVARGIGPICAAKFGF